MKVDLCDFCLSFDKCEKNQILGSCSSYLEWAKEEEEEEQYNWMDDVDCVENICNDGGFAGL